MRRFEKRFPGNVPVVSILRMLSKTYDGGISLATALRDAGRVEIG